MKFRINYNAKTLTHSPFSKKGQKTVFQHFTKKKKNV